MAGELQVSFQHLLTIYFLIRNKSGLIWNNNTSAFEVYSTANYANYTISSTEEGTASAYYIGNFPAAITAGVYSVVAKQQTGGGPLETDPTIAVGDEQWNGTTIAALSDVVTSGLLSYYFPQKPARGVMIQNWPVYLVSDVDNKTPFVSGTISGQISRDNGAFGPLQSGAFTEIGLGHYNLSALTSGDMLANTVRLNFTGTGPSGSANGNARAQNITMILQKVSGQA